MSTSTRRRTTFVDHGNGGLVVNKHGACTRVNSLQFLPYIAKVFDGLRARNGGIELSFSRAGANDGLDSTLPCNGSMAEEEGIASHGSLRLEFGCMGGIKEADQFITRETEEGMDLVPTRGTGCVVDPSTALDIGT